MKKRNEKIMFEDIDNAIDAILYECLVDIPKVYTDSCNTLHTEIIDHIIAHIQNTHKKFYDAEEDYDT